MSWGVTGILVFFGAFVLLLVLNPKLSCFGKRLKSPFYPLLRRKQLERERARQAPPVKTEDYGFRLSDDESARLAAKRQAAKDKAEDYGFKLN